MISHLVSLLIRPNCLFSGSCRIGRTWLPLLLGAACLALSGCATVPATSDADDAEAKRFTVVPDKGVVYVVAGYSDAINLKVDQGSVGSLGSKMFLMLHLSPGRHVLHAEYYDKAEEECILSVEPGRIYYVATGALPGVKPACFFKTITEQEGQALVMKSKRASAMTGSAQSVLGR